MPGPDVAANRFRVACEAGGALATFVFCWMITNARWDFFSEQAFGQIQDAQARSLFHGRWDVPADVVGIEGFKIHDHYYTYFGPFLAVLRMPVLLVTDHLDGRLTILSMLLGFGVLLVATSHLHWRVRSVMRGDQPVSTAEWVCVAVFTFAVGVGSIVAFLDSRGLIYHEVELWGVAWAVATTDALVGFAIRSTRRHAIAAGACATAAIMTRVSVGVGAVAALGLVAGAQCLWRWRGDRAPGLARIGPGADAEGRFHIVPLMVAIVVAVGLYGAVNVARFGSLYQLPLDKQVFTELDAHRRVTLDANGGSLFGAKFAPTGTLQYLRPDAIRLSSEFPWVDFPPHATVVGDVIYDTIDRSSSVPASMPGFTVLAIIGIVALFRPRRFSTTLDLARFWPPIIGGVIGTAFVLTIAFIAQRYLADFFPPLLFAAIIGGQCLLKWVVDTKRWAVLAVAGVVFVAGAWISFGLGRVYQQPRPNAGAERGAASVVVRP